MSTPAKYGDFIKNYNGVLKGATIQEFHMWDEPEDMTSDPRMVLLIETKDKQLFTIHVDQDPEGNGPGWLSLEKFTP